MIEYNGKSYARVSDVLSAFSDYSHIDPAVLANKCRIGTEVHKAIETDIQKGFPVFADDCLGYFESYEKWKDHLNVVFVESEKRYFDEEKMISGQIDALALMGSSPVPILVDFKTSAQESKEVWPMQAHMYGMLLKSNSIKIQPRYLFVKLDKYGGIPSVFAYVFDENTHAKCLEAIEKFWSR